MIIDLAAMSDIGTTVWSGRALQSRPNASPFWIMLLLSFGRRDRRMIAAVHCRLLPP